MRTISCLTLNMRWRKFRRAQKRSSQSVRVFSSYIQSDIVTPKMTLVHDRIEFHTKNETLARLYPIAGAGDVDFFVDASEDENAGNAL